MVTNENCHKVEAFHPNLGKTVGPDGAADPHGAANGLIGAGSCFLIRRPQLSPEIVICCALFLFIAVTNEELA